MNRQRSILLVEDNPDDVELTILAFEENGVRNRLVVARDGTEALDCLFGRSGHQAPELPVIILLDLNLPKLDGIEVLKRIRSNERTRLVPVIVLTSSSEDRDLIESYRFGANSYVRKPVDFDEFHSATRQLSTYWLTLNEPPPVSGD